MTTELEWTEAMTFRLVVIGDLTVCESKLDAGTEVTDSEGRSLAWFHTAAEALAYVQGRLSQS